MILAKSADKTRIRRFVPETHRKHQNGSITTTLMDATLSHQSPKNVFAGMMREPALCQMGIGTTRIWFEKNCSGETNCPKNLLSQNFHKAA